MVAAISKILENLFPILCNLFPIFRWSIDNLNRKLNDLQFDLVINRGSIDSEDFGEGVI